MNSPFQKGIVIKVSNSYSIINHQTGFSGHEIPLKANDLFKSIKGSHHFRTIRITGPKIKPRRSSFFGPFRVALHVGSSVLGAWKQAGKGRKVGPEPGLVVMEL